MAFGPSRKLPNYGPGAVQSQSLAPMGFDETMAMLNATAPKSPIQAPKDRGMFGRFKGFNPLRFDPDKGVGEGNRLYALGAMLAGMGTGDPALTANLLEPKLQQNRERVQARDEEAKRQQMMQGLAGLTDDPREQALLRMGLGGEQMVDREFAPAPEPKDPLVINNRVVDRNDPTRMIANYSDAPQAEYTYETVGDNIVAIDKRDPNNRIVVGPAPVKQPLVNVNTGDPTQGQRPIIDKPPKDMAYVWDPETNRYRAEPIQGTETARDRETFAIKSAAAQKADDEQFATMVNNIDTAIEQAGFWSAGLMSQATGQIGATPARNLRATLDTIVANIGFDKLNEMRQTSPTGGALGNVTERELAFLQAVRGSLDQAQSPEQLRKTLTDVKASLERLYEARRIAAQLNMTNSGDRVPTGNLMQNPEVGELLQFMTPEERALFEGDQ